jgi:hypothetical protein
MLRNLRAISEKIYLKIWCNKILNTLRINNVLMDLTGVYAMFAAILAASGFFLFMGTVGLKGDKKEDELHKAENT